MRSMLTLSAAAAAMGLMSMVGPVREADAGKTVSPFAGEYAVPWGGVAVSISSTGGVKGFDTWFVIDPEYGSGTTVIEKFQGTVTDDGTMTCRGTLSRAGPDFKFAFMAAVTLDSYGTLRGTVTSGDGPFPTGSTFGWAPAN